MKTAEELAKDFIAGFMASHTSDYVFNSIRKIQLDAMKEGARRAADKIQPLKYRGLYDMRNAILTAAEQLTEKDL